VQDRDVGIKIKIFRPWSPQYLAEGLSTRLALISVALRPFAHIFAQKTWENVRFLENVANLTY
jgi:hypothetical protein